MGELLTAESLLVVAVMTATGLVLVWLGRHIRHSEALSLVAGTRGATVADPAGLTELVGTVTAVTGGVTILVGFLSVLVPAPERSLLWGGYIVLVLALAGWAHRRSRAYTE